MLSVSPFLVFAALVAAQTPDLVINTPASITQCQPVQISWSATKPPVFISILPGGQPNAVPLRDLGQQTTSPLTWVANIPANTPITFQARDSTGALAYSAPITIQNSSNSTCLNVA